jgi:hypothetical protein
MVGTVVMRPLYEAYEIPSGWLPCDGTKIPNDNGEGEELIKMLKKTYPKQYPEGLDIYLTPEYRDLYTKNDIYSDLFLNFIIYAGANVKNCFVESISGVTYIAEENSKYTNHSGESTIEFKAGNDIIGELEDFWFGIWLCDSGILLSSVDVNAGGTYDLTFTLGDKYEAGQFIASQPIYCGFMPNNEILKDGVKGVNYRNGTYAVEIKIPDIVNDIDKKFTMTVGINTTRVSFTINDFVKQTCN